MQPQSTTTRRRSSNPNSVVYFLQGRHGGPIKIGYASDEFGAEARLGSCQTGNPTTLVIRNTIPGGRAMESYLHGRFAEWRIRGEWFEPVAELAEMANAIPLSEADTAELKESLRREYDRGFRDGEEEASLMVAEQFQAELHKWMLNRGWTDGSFYRPGSCATGNQQDAA